MRRLFYLLSSAVFLMFAMGANQPSCVQGSPYASDPANNSGAIGERPGGLLCYPQAYAGTCLETVDLYTCPLTWVEIDASTQEEIPHEDTVLAYGPDPWTCNACVNQWVAGQPKVASYYPVDCSLFGSYRITAAEQAPGVCPASHDERGAQ